MARSKEYIKKMNKYVDDVLSGERKAGRLEIKTVERHVNDLKYAVEKGIFWDERAAMKALEFFSLCGITRGNGRGLNSNWKVGSVSWWLLFLDGKRREGRGVLTWAI